jgi:putative tricarboxylic transport membrane protein
LFAVLVNLAFIPAFVWVLRMPFTILAPIIFVLCIIGGYAPTQDLHDVWLMLLFGVMGYLLRKLEYPMAPAVLAIVLGPLAESSMRQSLLINHGNPMIFFERPISGPIMLTAMLLFLVPAIQAVRRRLRRRRQAAPRA